MRYLWAIGIAAVIIAQVEYWHYRLAKKIESLGIDTDTSTYAMSARAVPADVLALVDLSDAITEWQILWMPAVVFGCLMTARFFAPPPAPKPHRTHHRHSSGHSSRHRHR